MNFLTTRKSSLVKVTRPQPARILLRERLFKVLDDDSELPGTWVIGPPGSGKTALIASYLEQRRLQGLWYRIDGRDTDPASFFYYLGMAIASFSSLSPPSLPMHSLEDSSCLSSFTHSYFEQLYSYLPEGFVIVFDNYQHLPESSPLHEMIRDALARIPEDGRIIFISHLTPPPEFARLCANRALVTLDWPQLRLTEGETAGIVNMLAAYVLPEEGISELHKRCEGWVAGLLLLLTYTRVMGGSLPQALRECAPETVFDYFGSEIFQHLAAETQAVLLRTAFLPKMSAAMAEELTGLPRSREILAHMTLKHYFIELHNDPEPVYQFHALFREFLLARARRDFTTQDLMQVRLCAARVMEAAGETEDAIDLFHDAAEWEEMARLVRQQAPVLIAQGRSKTLESWLRKLPAARLDTEPWLRYWLGVCGQSMYFEQSLAYFEQAFTLFELNRDEQGALLAWSGAVNCICYSLNDIARLDTWIAWLDTRMYHTACFPSLDLEAQVSSSMAAALFFRQTTHPQIFNWMERTLGLARHSETINLFPAIEFYLWRGELAKAGLIMGSVKARFESAGASPLVRLNCKLTEAYYYCLTGEPEECLQTAAAGLTLAQNTGVHRQDYMFLALKAWAARTLGNLADAESFIRTLVAPDSLKPFDACRYHQLAGWFAMLQGDADSALLHGEISLTLAGDNGMSYPQAVSHLALAQVCFERNDDSAAVRHLAAASEIGAALHSLYLEFMCRLTQAQFALWREPGQAALDLLRSALMLGREQRFFVTIWWRREVMARMAWTALEAGVETGYVCELVKKYRLMPDPLLPLSEHWPWPVKIYVLGEFRLDIDGRENGSGRKTQHRPLEMLKALIALGGREVKEESLADALWPEAEGDAAHGDFAITLHRLRKLLGNEKAITRRNRRLTLESRHCWVDSWAFERLTGRALTEQSADVMQQALMHYRGAFLPQDTGQGWSTSLRLQLRGKFIRQVLALGLLSEEAGELEKAVECYAQALEVEPQAEEICQQLMKCYIRLDRPYEAGSFYQRCITALTAEGLKPSPQTEELYRTLSD